MSAMRGMNQDCDVIGTGTNHVLLPNYFENSEKVFQKLHEEYLQYLPKKEIHFIKRYNWVLHLTIEWFPLKDLFVFLFAEHLVYIT